MQETDYSNYIITLVDVKDMDDNQIYHYVAIKEENIENFANAVKSGKSYDLARLGIVLESGIGQPSDRIKEKMKNLYKCNHESKFNFNLASEV